MKSLGTYAPPESVGINFTRLATPSGRAMPRAPVPGELFTLEADMPEPDGRTPWLARGTYAWDEQSMMWMRLNDSARKRKAEAIGSQKIEIEAAEVASVDVIPTIDAGFGLAAVGIPPSNRKASFSGVGTCWVDVNNACHVWLVAFRGEKMVGVTATVIEPERPQTLTLTFTDFPNSTEEQAYTLRIYTDTTGTLFVNQCNRFNFDALSQTAFIVEENLN